MAQLIQNGDVLSGTSNDSANIMYSEPDGSSKNVKEKIEELDSGLEEVNNSLTTTNTNMKKIKTYVGSDGKLHFVDATGADSVLPFSSLKPPKFVRGTNIARNTWTTVSGAKVGDIIVLAAGGGGLSVSGASQLYYWNTNTINIGAYRVTSVNPQVTNLSSNYDVAYVLISYGD